jgi:endonuclease/exonuclease/phosphatase family metal-dependent hydrolase
MPELSLLTWNVRYFSHRTRGLVAHRRGFDDVARALVSCGPPDLVALQEVETSSWRGGRGPQLARLLSALDAAANGSSRRYTAMYYPAHRYPSPWGGAPVFTTGLAWLVAEPLVVLDHNAGAPHEITHRRLPSFAGWKQSRVCAHVRVAVPGASTPLDLFNTHLSLPAFFVAESWRLPLRGGFGPNQATEARAVAAFVRAIARGPAVLVGDFNSSPGSPAYDTIVASGLRDAFLDATPSAYGVWTTQRIGALRFHLDHVFATPDLRFLGFDGSHPADRPGRFEGISDHVPKLARLAVA